ncbi:MAG: vitamin K epoxide reductase family protein [Bacteroidetes bacterium]|nr:vitamin K epoxide reductase family protein [Bacteroidota bacterium]
MKVRILLIIGSLIGLIDAFYLTWEKISGNPALCIQGLGDCYSVNNSTYSEFFGIPVAVLGAGVYLLILAVLFLEQKNSFFKSNSTFFVFGITLVGTLFSAYLTYIEIAVIKKICPFCVISAITMLVLLVFSVVRLIKYQADNNS